MAVLLVLGNTLVLHLFLIITAFINFLNSYLFFKFIIFLILYSWLIYFIVFFIIGVLFSTVYNTKYETCHVFNMVGGYTEAELWYPLYNLANHNKLTKYLPSIVGNFIISVVTLVWHLTYILFYLTIKAFLLDLKYVELKSI